jgi:hypothetical protein
MYYKKPAYMNPNYGSYGTGYDVVNAGILEGKVQDLINALNAGDAPNKGEMWVNITTALLAPPTERLAYLQAAWWTAKASRVVGGKAGKAPMTAKATEYLELSKSAGQDATASPQVIKAPIDAAATFISQYGMETLDIVSNLRMAGATTLIQDTQKDVKKYSAGTMVYDATEKTITDIGKPFVALKNLLTSDLPKWKFIRWGIYGMVGLGVLGYAAKQVGALKGDDD